MQDQTDLLVVSIVGSVTVSSVAGVQGPGSVVCVSLLVATCDWVLLVPIVLAMVYQEKFGLQGRQVVYEELPWMLP